MFDQPAEPGDLADHEVDAPSPEASQGGLGGVEGVDPDVLFIQVLASVLLARTVSGIADADAGEVDPAGRAEARKIFFADGDSLAASQIGAAQHD